MPKFSRRKFIKLAASATASGLVPGVPFISRSAYASETSLYRTSIGVNLDSRYPVLNSFTPPGGVNAWQYMVDRCVLAGIDTVRVDLTRWSWVERQAITQPGVMFDTHDSVAASDTILPMLQAAGIRVYTMLRQNLPAAFSSPWPINQTERDRFWRYCQWFLDRWGSYLYAVELLNEPELATDGSVNIGRTDSYVQHYGDLVLDIGAKLKANYPEVKVVACNINDWGLFYTSDGWLRRLFTYAFPNQGEWNSYFDEIGVHYYFTGETDFSRTKMQSFITRLHDYFSSNYNNGISMPISVTETGSSLAPTVVAWPGYPEVTVEQQQLWMENTFEAVKNMPFLKNVLFYELFENTSVPPEHREANFAYIKRDYSELATMTTLEQGIADYREFANISNMDFNNNNIVDPADFSRLKAKLGSLSDREDLNGNGIVDPADLSLLKAYLGKLLPGL